MRLGAALLVAVLCSACGGGGSASPPTQRPGTVAIGGEIANDHGSADLAGARGFDVQVGSYYFAPTVLTGEPGRSVELRFTSRSERVHNVSVDRAGVDEDIDPGATVTVHLQVPESGTLVFYCAFHRQLGMLGAIVAA